MRPLRYSINVTLDGCCDHRVMMADEELHRHAAANLERADALLFGRVTYEMMEAAWRPSARTGARPDWMVPFARKIDAAKPPGIPVGGGGSALPAQSSHGLNISSPAGSACAISGWSSGE
jgi:hypothetical protein